MKNSDNKYLLYLLILSIYFINIKLISINSFAIRPIELFTFFFIIVIFKNRFNQKNFILFSFFTILPFLGISNILSFTEFFKSYFFYFISLLILFFLPSIIAKVEYNFKILFFKFIFTSYCYVIIYGLVQFFFINVFSLDILYNNFGIFQYHPHFQNDLFGLSRATSIFYEPSVFAWATNLIIVLFVYLRKNLQFKKNKYYLYLFIYFSGLLVTISSSGFLTFSFLLLFYYLSYKASILRNLVIFIPFFAFLVTVLYPFFRLDEIAEQNTSGYARLFFPFLNLLEVLNKYLFFGRGLGQFGVDDSSLNYDGVIHNSVLGIIITFGLSSIFYLMIFFIKIKKYYILSKKSIILWVNLILIFFSTGSFLSLELPIIYVIITLAVNTRNVDVYAS